LLLTQIDPYGTVEMRVIIPVAQTVVLDAVAAAGGMNELIVADIHSHMLDAGAVGRGEEYEITYLKIFSCGCAKR